MPFRSFASERFSETRENRIMWWRLLIVAAVLSSLGFGQYVQYGAPKDVGLGRLLVANKALGDPNFAEAVILIVAYDPEKGTSGLILNRRTKVPLSKLFPDVKTASSDAVFQGGPVEE